MKKTAILVTMSFLVLTACENKQNQEIEVKHAHDMPIGKKIEVEVVNEIDPICGMNTAEYLSDTAEYKGETYGFCSTSCKDKFLAEPEKYVQK